MLDEPLVSVVLPTFNRKNLVERAVVSVLNQTYRNLELFVIDDGSSDGTEKSLSCYCNDPRFHYTYQENKGQSAARNRGIASASGDLIAFLDSDNYWAIDKIQRQLGFWSDKYGYDILYSLGFNVDIVGNIIKTKINSQRPSGRIINSLILGNCVTNNTILVSRRCFEEMGGFDESLRIAEDYDLWLRFATRYDFLHHPEHVTYYCVEGDRLSALEGRNIEANFHILKRFFYQFPDLVSPQRKRKALGNLLIWRIESNWNRGIRPSRKELLRSIISNPFDQRVWRHFAKYFVY